MRGKRYPQEFKIQAVKQVVDKVLTMTDVAQRLGVTYKSFTRGFKNKANPTVRERLRMPSKLRLESQRPNCVV